MTNQISLAQLPDGTAIEVMVRYGPFDVAHQGILQRAWNGHILILENSKNTAAHTRLRSRISVKADR